MDNRLGQAVLPTITNPQYLPISYMNRLDTKKSNIKGCSHWTYKFFTMNPFIDQGQLTQVPPDFQIFAIKKALQTL